jgi:hypothetical protein
MRWGWAKKGERQNPPIPYGYVWIVGEISVVVKLTKKCRMDMQGGMPSRRGTIGLWDPLVLVQLGVSCVIKRFRLRCHL